MILASCIVAARLLVPERSTCIRAFVSLGAQNGSWVDAASRTYIAWLAFVIGGVDCGHAIVRTVIASRALCATG